MLLLEGIEEIVFQSYKKAIRRGSLQAAADLLSVADIDPALAQKNELNRRRDVDKVFPRMSVKLA